MIFFCFGTLLLSVLTLHSGRISNFYLLLIPSLAIVYLAISQIGLSAPLNRWIGVVASISYYLIVITYGPELDTAQRESLTEKFIWLSVALLVAESIWRMSHPDPEYSVYANADDFMWIYQYKFGGLMYVDSNGVAIHIVVLFFFLIYRERNLDKSYLFFKIILLILLVFTFSRAAWIGTVSGLAYINFVHRRFNKTYAINLVMLVIAALILYKFFLEDKIENDFSFRSKLDIAAVTLNYLKEATPHELFYGVGFSNSLTRLGNYAHNFFIVFFIESGFVGFVFILAMLAQFVIITRGKALFILVPFLITTLSSSIMFLPYFYVIIALVYLDGQESKSRQQVK